MINLISHKTSSDTDCRMHTCIDLNKQTCLVLPELTSYNDHGHKCSVSLCRFDLTPDNIIYQQV